MIPPIDLPAVAMMKRQGGSFVQQLVILAIHADVINYAKIRKTWSNYFEEYNRTALREAERLGTLCLKCKGGSNRIRFVRSIEIQGPIWSEEIFKRNEERGTA